MIWGFTPILRNLQLVLTSVDLLEQRIHYATIPPTSCREWSTASWMFTCLFLALILTTFHVYQNSASDVLWFPSYDTFVGIIWPIYFTFHLVRLVLKWLFTSALIGLASLHCSTAFLPPLGHWFYEKPSLISGGPGNFRTTNNQDDNNQQPITTITHKHHDQARPSTTKHDHRQPTKQTNNTRRPKGKDSTEDLPGLTNTGKRAWKWRFHQYPPN